MSFSSWLSVLSSHRPTSSDVDVNSEVPERSRKNFEITCFDDFQKISRFFPREILNDLFWLVTISAGTLNTKRSG